MVDSNGDVVEDYIASFLGYAPADNPKYAMLMFFDTPTGDNYYGSVVAAPVFSQIMEEVLPYLEVETEYTDSEREDLDVIADQYVGLSTEDAQQKISDAGLTPVVKGSGSKVIAQMPESNSTVPKGGTVVLYTDKSSAKETVEVPNLLDMSLSDVNSIASQYGLNVSVKGTSSTSGDGISTKQSIAEGTKVSEGTVITVTFLPQSGIAE